MTVKGPRCLTGGAECTVVLALVREHLRALSGVGVRGGSMETT
jgi:hypothetical protein